MPKPTKNKDGIRWAGQISLHLGMFSTKEEAEAAEQEAKAIISSAKEEDTYEPVERVPKVKHTGVTPERLKYLLQYQKDNYRQEHYYKVKATTQVAHEGALVTFEPTDRLERTSPKKPYFFCAARNLHYIQIPVNQLERIKIRVRKTPLQTTP